MIIDSSWNHKQCRKGVKNKVDGVTSNKNKIYFYLFFLHFALAECKSLLQHSLESYVPLLCM